jgi:hypothetical protein
MSASPQQDIQTTRGLRGFDLCVVLVLGAATGWLRHSCTPWSDVSGDAYMALECAWKMWNGDWAAVPSQPIYGYGLCASMAGLYVGTEELWQVALRRSLVGTVVVPGWYILTLLAVPRLFSVSPLATRFAGVLIGVFALNNNLLGVMATSGTLGYFAPPLLAVIFICWSVALQRRAPMLCVLSLALIPITMMNHPFTLWLVPTALIFAPALARSSGRLACGLGLTVATAISVPRVVQLIALIRREESWIVGLKVIADPGGRLDEPYAQKLIVDLQHPENILIPLALVLITVTPLLLRRRTQGLAELRLWAIAGAVSSIVVVVVGASIQYLRSYHVMFLYPFAVVALAGWVAMAADRFGPWLRERSPLGGLRDRLSAWQPTLVTFALCWLVFAGVVFSSMDKGSLRPSEDHCTGGFKNTSTAASARIVTDRLQQDLPEHAIVIENLRPSDGGVDSAVSIALDLLVRGLRESQLRCCEPGVEPTWYWIVDWRGLPLDFRALVAEVDGVDLLLDLEIAEELILAVRTDAARIELGEALCGAVPDDQWVSGRTYRTYLGNLLVPGCDEPPPPEPYPPCIADRVIF